MSTRYQLIELLADGRFRSGQWLGEQLGISRAAVWKQVKALADLGLDVHAVRGQGYKLAQAFQPLDAGIIRSSLEERAGARVQSLEVFQEIASTSDYLKQHPRDLGESQANVCVAEWQSAGRGRRGRHWVSPYGANLYLSLETLLSEAGIGAGGLSLVAAIAVTDALERCGVDDLGVKWPNDVYYRGRKLAGILLDLSGESGGPYRLVVGVGINFNMPVAAAQAIDQPWADMSQSGANIDRNHFAALIIDSLLDTMDLFNQKGLDAFVHTWKRFDLVSDRAVELHHEHQPMIRGVARGIDSRGALLIERNGETRSYHAGEVTLRLS